MNNELVIKPNERLHQEQLRQIADAVKNNNFEQAFQIIHEMLSSYISYDFIFINYGDLKKESSLYSPKTHDPVILPLVKVNGWCHGFNEDGGDLFSFVPPFDPFGRTVYENKGKAYSFSKLDDLGSAKNQVSRKNNLVSSVSAMYYKPFHFKNMLIIHDFISINQILYLPIIRTDGICFNKKEIEFLENIFLGSIFPLLRNNIPTSKLSYKVKFFGHNDYCAPMVGYFLTNQGITLNNACNILNSIGLLTSQKKRWKKTNLQTRIEQYEIEDKILYKSLKEIDILKEFVERVVCHSRSKS